MVNMPNIVFVGGTGSGKSTAGAFLADIGYTVYPIATPLKDVAAMLWGEEARKDRFKLQTLGTEIARVIDPDVWANLAAKYVDEHPVPIVIDDLRFWNEYWLMKERGFKFVRITANEDSRLDRLKLNGKNTTREQLNHESESFHQDFDVDYEIENDGDSVEFIERVAKLMGRLTQ